MFFQKALKTIQTWWNQYIAGPVSVWVELVIAWYQRCKVRATKYYKTREERIAAWYRHRKASFIEDFEAMRTWPTIDVSPETPKVPASEKTFKISWEIYDSHGGEFRTRILLNDASNHLTFFGPTGQEVIQKSSPLIAKVVKAIFSVPGIENILIFKYHVRISKAELFSWDEIIPEINAALAAAFGYTEDEIVDTTPVSK